MMAAEWLALCVGVYKSKKKSRDHMGLHGPWWSFLPFPGFFLPFSLTAPSRFSYEIGSADFDCFSGAGEWGAQGKPNQTHS